MAKKVNFPLLVETLVFSRVILSQDVRENTLIVNLSTILTVKRERTADNAVGSSR